MGQVDCPVSLSLSYSKMRFCILSVALTCLLLLVRTAQGLREGYIVNAHRYLVADENGKVLLRENNQFLPGDRPLLLTNGEIKVPGEFSYVPEDAVDDALFVGDTPVKRVEVSYESLFFSKENGKGSESVKEVHYMSCWSGGCFWGQHGGQWGWEITTIRPTRGAKEHIMPPEDLDSHHKFSASSGHKHRPAAHSGSKSIFANIFGKLTMIIPLLVVVLSAYIVHHLVSRTSSA